MKVSLGGRKRQLTKTDPETVTLSALRVLVITALHGRGGLGLSSATAHEETCRRA
ncbi:hypothetical protein [Streptomyces lushanensis]|uniref:hypothetical protein n=1 Tax=Streptomyces lushanensis TaxID=1434255 RepID=UPI000A6F040A|nr:hypothetical protein [Streptomyces lushanensis]